MMKVLGKMGNCALSSSLASLGILFYTEVWETAGKYAFDGCCCHVTEGLYLNITLALWNYIVTQIKLF